MSIISESASRAAPVIGELLSKEVGPRITNAACKFTTEVAPTATKAAVDLVRKTTPVARDAIKKITDLSITLAKRTGIHTETLASRILPVLKKIEGCDTYKVGKSLHDLIGTVARLTATTGAIVAGVAGCGYIGYTALSYGAELAGFGTAAVLKTAKGRPPATTTAEVAPTAPAVVTATTAEVAPTAPAVATATPAEVTSATNNHSFFRFAHSIISHPLIASSALVAGNFLIYEFKHHRQEKKHAVALAEQEKKHAAALAEQEKKHSASVAELAKKVEKNQTELVQLLSPRSRGESGEIVTGRTQSNGSITNISTGSNPTTPESSRTRTRLPNLNLGK